LKTIISRQVRRVWIRRGRTHWSSPWSESIEPRLCSSLDHHNQKMASIPL